MKKPEYYNVVTRLYLSHQPVIMSGFRKKKFSPEDIEDAFNEVFTSLAEKYPYDEIQDITIVDTWYSVKRLLFLNRYRRGKGGKYTLKEETISIDDIEDNLSAMAEMRSTSINDYRTELKLLLRDVPEMFQLKYESNIQSINARRFLLEYIDALNVEEVSKRMGISVRAGNDVLNWLLEYLDWSDKFTRNRV